MTRAYLGVRRSGIGPALPGLLALAALLVVGLLLLVKPMLVLAIPFVAGFIVCILRPAWGLYALMAMLFFAPITINLGWSGLASTYVYFAALALAIGGRLVRAISKTQRFFEASGILWLLLPVVLTGVVHGTSPNEWLTHARPLLVLVVVSWHLVAEARLDPQRVRRVALMVAWAAPALFLLAAYQRVAGFWPVLDQFAISKSYTSRGDASRSAAVMGHSILYGGYSMVTAIIAAWLQPKWWKLIVVLSLGGLLLSGARSAWVGAVIALAVIVLLKRPKITFMGLYGCLIGACALVLAMINFPAAVDDLWSVAAGRLENVTESSSALARQLRVDIAWNQITQTEHSWWWGLGPGALVAYFTVNKTSDNLAATFDNSYLTLWYDYGIFPLVAFAAVMLAAIIRRGNTLGRILMLALAAQIFFFDFYQWPLMIGAIALAAGLRQKEKLPDHKDEVPVVRQPVPLHRDKLQTLP